MHASEFPLRREMNQPKHLHQPMQNTHIPSCVDVYIYLQIQGISYLYIYACICVTSFNGGEEFMAPTTVEQITSGPYRGYRLVHPANPYSPLPPPNGKLVPGEVYYLMPDLGRSYSPPVSPRMAGKDGSCGRIKVMVSKRQFEELMMKSGSTKEVPSEEFAIRVMEVEEECRSWKWQPSLATIPELRVCLDGPSLTNCIHCGS